MTFNKILGAVLLCAGSAEAASLDKYSAPMEQTAFSNANAPVATPVIVPPPAPPMPAQTSALNARQRTALETLRRLSPARRQEWLETFRKKEAEAAARKDYNAALYYRDILFEARKEKK